jgi:lysophospholipase L1-like esterase
MHEKRILMFGDSIFDLHEGERRVEAILARRLRSERPEAQWTISNEAHGGEYIGPPRGPAQGVSEPLFDTPTTGRYFQILARHRRADILLLCYGANDSKAYPPQLFREGLKALSARLEKDFPGAFMAFTTTMFLDPAHSAPYHHGTPQVAGFRQGGSRNEYLAPYNAEIRAFTAAHGYGLADFNLRVQEETARGNWDLRVRGDGTGDPRDDPRHLGDMSWFDNIHPNDEGTRVLADVLLEVIRER